MYWIQDIFTHSLFPTMSYLPIRQLDPRPQDMDAEEFGHADSEDAMSFVRWRREHLYARAKRTLPRRPCSHGCVSVIACLIPWIINMILAVCLVSVVWKLDSESSVSHFPPRDLLYSKCGGPVPSPPGNKGADDVGQPWQEMPSNIK